MSRMHAPELEDEPWFPRPLRDSLTAFLQVSAEKLQLFKDAAPVLSDVVARHAARQATGTQVIVDLCSGGGGPLLSIIETKSDPTLSDVNVVLTDLYPNASAFLHAESRLLGRVRGELRSVDATDVPANLVGVRTIFNALHHFRPDGARKILVDAASKRQPLCVFEVVERHAAAFAVIAGVPFAVLALTPWTKPTLARLALTYALPIIPLMTGWDGFASCLRAYSVEELQALADAAIAESGVDDYAFRVGQSERGQAGRGDLPMRVTWLVGEPVD